MNAMNIEIMKEITNLLENNEINVNINNKDITNHEMNLKTTLFDNPTPTNPINPTTTTNNQITNIRVSILLAE